jgi:hypothetical protein
MNQSRVLSIAFAVAIALCFPKSHRASAQPPSGTRLWAAISASQPAYRLSEVSRLTLNFSVVNDGGAIVDPGVHSSHLFVNGVELPGWPMIVHNGPKTSDFAALPPGQALSFGYQFSGIFARPGIYTVSWENSVFRSREITFRVMPGGN